jgi:hypothetical protein
MLAHARILGYTFDPLTVFWCLTPVGEVRAVVFEVHNTYGERHAYLLELDERGAGTVDKRLYVSPFNDVSGSYTITLRMSPSRISASIVLNRHGRRVLTAAVTGTPRPATRSTVLKTAVRPPVDDPPRQRPHPAARNLAMAAPPARRTPFPPLPEGHPLSTITHPTERPSRVPAPAPAPLRHTAAKAILAAVQRLVPVQVLLPGCESLSVTDPRVDPDAPTVEIVRAKSLIRRLARHPKIGVGEAYMAGDWRAAPGTDLASALLPFAQQLTTAVPPVLRRLRCLVDRPIPSPSATPSLGRAATSATTTT